MRSNSAVIDKLSWAKLMELANKAVISFETIIRPKSAVVVCPMYEADKAAGLARHSVTRPGLIHNDNGDSGHNIIVAAHIVTTPTIGSMHVNVQKMLFLYFQKSCFISQRNMHRRRKFHSIVNWAT